MDFRLAVVESAERLIASGAIQKAIEETLAKSVAAVVKDELGQYSEFGKALKAKVQTALKVYDEIDLPSYNDAILKIVRMQVEAATNAVVEREVAGRLKELLTPAPESIKFSELIEQYKERIKEENSAGCVCYGERHAISVSIEHEDRYGGRWTDVKLWDEAKGEGSPDIFFSVHGEKIWRLNFKNQQVEQRLFAGPFFYFERTLFQMKAAQTRIVMDVGAEDIDTEIELSHAD